MFDTKTMDVLRHFIIGNSVLVVLPFYFGAKGIRQRNYGLEQYAIYAALYFGVTNALSYIAAEHFQWTPTQRILWTGLISSMLISVLITVNRSYDFVTSQWIRQYMLLFFAHTAAFAVFNFLDQHI